jgi:predicted Zn-dependent peptidase
LDHDLLVKKVASIFSLQVKAKLNKFVGVVENQDKPQLKIFHKETEQTHMALGFHALKRGDSLRHAQALLHIILGANMSSRLFNEVREKRGLAYEIGTGVKRFADTGAFVVHAGIDNRKVQDCLGLIFKELSKIRNTLVSKDEFKRAKEFCLGQLSLALEDTMEHMLWMGESVACLDKVYTLEQVIKEVNKVKIEEIQAVAKMIFSNQKINLSLIGPLDKSHENIYAKLNLGKS